MYPSSTALPPVKGQDCEKIVINYLKSLGNAIGKYLENLPSIYKLRWARKAKDGDEERFEIVDKTFAYEGEKGEKPSDYPDSPAHPNPGICVSSAKSLIKCRVLLTVFQDMANPFATLTFVLTIGLPKRQYNNRFWYDERFEVHTVQGSAKTSFFLVHNGKKYDAEEVVFSK
ncbi:hypothetical protein MGU_07968 [Metarhizium guizhouense ARSEF 977]|uniref:Uncharacterized protein n=1 Tax=Metarhizium guizhouense (strain ARSEF 977) TaxID=1276136 RepID=A0A0B4GQC0_METGA|nr:hypothetical protein MGU_07968 [Metarhizium guizhouense ARSEF 977]